MAIEMRRRAGVEGHIARAHRFLAEAKNLEGEAEFDHLLAAVSSARAAVQILLDWADHDYPNTEARSFVKAELDAVPHAILIERVRIHDFHRFGMLLTGPTATFYGGPVKFRLAGKGAAASMRLTPQGPKFATSGGSTVDEQRPLVTRGAEVLDEGSRSWLHLRDIVVGFLDGLPAAIARVENLVLPPP